MKDITTKKLHTTGCILFGLVLTLAGILGLHGDMLAETLGAVLPARSPSAAVDSAAAGTDAAAGAVTETELSVKTPMDPKKVPILPAEEISTEMLWLARCIYSETKRPEEQELVAWVVRNRVETNYRGKNSYRSVVLDPYQFSAFNPGSRKRDYYANLDQHSKAKGWQRALSIAHHVYHSDTTLRPFPVTTRHFFSERSMEGGRYPNWSAGKKVTEPQRSYTIPEERFRFYANVM